MLQVGQILHISVEIQVEGCKKEIKCKNKENMVPAYDPSDQKE